MWKPGPTLCIASSLGLVWSATNFAATQAGLGWHLFMAVVAAIILVAAYCPNWRTSAMFAGTLVFSKAVHSQLQIAWGLQPTDPAAILPGHWQLVVKIAGPLALLLAVGGLGAVLYWVCVSVRGRSVLQTGSVCPTCADDLTGNTTGVCPECGAAFSVDELRVEQQRKTGFINRKTLSAALGMMLFFAVSMGLSYGLLRAQGLTTDEMKYGMLYKKIVEISARGHLVETYHAVTARGEVVRFDASDNALVFAGSKWPVVLGANRWLLNEEDGGAIGRLEAVYNFGRPAMSIVQDGFLVDLNRVSCAESPRRGCLDWIPSDVEAQLHPSN